MCLKDITWYRTYGNFSIVSSKFRTLSHLRYKVSVYTDLSLSFFVSVNNKTTNI